MKRHCEFTKLESFGGGVLELKDIATVLIHYSW